VTSGEFIIWAMGAMAYYPFIVEWVRKDSDFKVDDLLLATILMIIWPLPVLTYVIHRFGNAFVIRLFSVIGWINDGMPDPNWVLLPKREGIKWVTARRK
jgi:hypothetical protein